MKRVLLFFSFLTALASQSQQTGKRPVPSVQQLAWHDMEFYLFAHFGPNTFTDKEWGEGDEPENVFNPTAFNAEQWCKIASEAGAKGIIITAKHHDGFCLWPGKYSSHTVRESKWKNGKGDVLKELSKACKKFGLKFGVYISPWDRNHPDYGTEKYNDVFIGMMGEIFKNYSPVWELWWDGANGEGPNGKKQVYDWRRFENYVRKVSPHTVIFSDIGPDIRWVGNENGIAGKTNWNYLDTAGFLRGIGAPHTDTLNVGNINGKNWIPAECDVSIRPGWFYHPQEDDKVKSPEQLFQLYLKSVGRGANLLLNVPPDRRGLIHEQDSISLIGFRKLIDESFKDNLCKNAKEELHYKGNLYSYNNLIDGNISTEESLPDFRQGSFWIKFNPAERINCIVIREPLKNGQSISELNISMVNGSEDAGVLQLSTIGHKRIITFPERVVSAIRITIRNAIGPPALSEVETYLIDDTLIEK